MKRISLSISFSLLAGCSTIACKTEAPDVHIAPECLSTCELTAPTLSNNPGETIADAALKERTALKQCDIKRKLCAAALQRAQQAGAIK